MGSYGVHVNAQRTSLQKVEEAKEFVMAAKTNDANILVFIWNKCIRAPRITKERRDTVMDSF